MRGNALHHYERSLRTAEPLRIRHADGRVVELDIERWLAPADAVDIAVLARALAPVLDVGCGPGRIVRALADLGLLALGIDIAATAVEMTRRPGFTALRRSVFDHVPGEGRWQTLLLLDGNIGIGGDPELLLGRAAELLAPAGRLIIETHPDPAADEQCLVRFTRTEKPIGPAFRWAHVGVRAACDYAAGAGYAIGEVWSADGRTFVLARTAND
jgi:SAM-dependent methyltransferase